MSAVTVGGLARSSAYVNAAQLWQMCSRLLLTPLVISTIGLDGYGAWALLFGLCSYALALDAGAGWVYAKLTAELDERGDYGALSEVISSGLVLIGAASLLGMGGLYLFRSTLLPVFGVPGHLLIDTERTLVVLTAAVVLEASAGCALDVLAGLQRMDLAYRLIIAGSAVEFATSFSLLHFHVGLVSLPLGLLAGGIVSTGGAWIECRRLRPMLKISPLHVSTSGFTQVVRLGTRYQSLLVVNALATQGIRLAVSSFYGTNAVAIYHLADRVLFVSRTPGAALVSPLMPAFASLDVEGRRYRWRSAFLRASRAVGAASVTALLFASLFASPILFAWTGQHFSGAAWTVRILAAAEVATLLMGVACARLRASGNVRVELTAVFISVAATVIGFAIAHPLIGYLGAVIAIACGRVLGSVWLLHWFARTERLNRRTYLRRTVLVPFAVCGPVCVVVVAAATSLPALASQEANRWTVLGTVLLLAAGYLLLCAPLAWLFGLSRGERSMLRRMVPGAGQAVALEQR